MIIVSRKEAQNKGLTNYFTGKPCKRGHISQRNTRNCSCAACKKEEYHTKYKAGMKQQYQENREEKIQKVMDRQKANSAAYLKYQKKWRDSNKEKIAQYRKDEKPRYAAHAAKRRAQRINATPVWADLEAIQWLYQDAAKITSESGIPHEVDHCVPLISDCVCGLHVLENLEILTATENRSKKNKLLV